MDSILRALVDTRLQVQRNRIQFGNRVAALERGDDFGSGQQLTIAIQWFSRYSKLERQLDGDISDIVQEHIMYESIIRIRGIGPMMAAKLLALLAIEDFENISKLWRHSGYAVIDGKREKPVRGQRLAYSKRLKTTLFLIGQSFLKTSSPYRDLYDVAREKYDNERDWTPLHCHYAAIGYMVKRFLSHLWVHWREIEGLEVSLPYIHAVGGHEHIDDSEYYGWPELVVA